jgi:uncharacterized protein
VDGHTWIGTRVPLERKPSDYFRDRVWISCDPDERTIPHLAERFGADRFLWASDFPHADHTPDYLDDLAGLVAGFADDADRRLFLGDTARRLYDIPARAGAGRDNG